MDKNQQQNLDQDSDDNIIQKIITKQIQLYNLEKYIQDYTRCVHLRRKYYKEVIQLNISDDIPFDGYEYERIYGNCCENVIGYISLPVGIVGPIFINNDYYYIPMATTEGCLVASTNRGARCVNEFGIKAILVDNGMTRAPVIRTSSIEISLKVHKWLKDESNFNQIKNIFDSTSRYAKLINIRTTLSGVFIYLRFKATTGDAMGMNMISLAVQASLDYLTKQFKSEIEVLSLSGNMCCDKKPSAINWIEGRGKSVICEAIIPENILKSRFNLTAQKLVEVNTSKNLVGSAMAGSIGGNNANAANVVSAIFAAAGQDLAQVVESSHCLTYMECRANDLYISCTMPCIEVGIIGGGTNLSLQSSYLKIMNLDRNPDINPTCNFALVICSTVLCCELSLMAALSTGTLVTSHLLHNRSKENLSTQKKTLN